MIESSYSKIAARVSILIRRFGDLAIKKLGSFVGVLRITSNSKKDAYGRETGASITSNIVTNVVIDYPLNEVELFDSVKDTNLNINSISLTDILPVNLFTSFNTDITSGELVNLERGDYIIHVLRDHRGNKIAIRLQVERLISSFMDKNINTLQYEASLVRGKLNTTAETMITNYINSLE